MAVHTPTTAQLAQLATLNAALAILSAALTTAQTSLATAQADYSKSVNSRDAYQSYINGGPAVGDIDAGGPDVT